MFIENEHGRIDFNYKDDLNDEEGECYLPDFYQDAVMEMCMIKASQKGGGHRLMQEFLSHEVVRKAKLIFLDCSPFFQEGEEAQVMQRLHDFYKRYGFVGKCNDGYSRLWRVQELPKTMDDCFSKGYDGKNDLHPILLASLEQAIHLEKNGIACHVSL